MEMALPCLPSFLSFLSFSFLFEALKNSEHFPFKEESTLSSMLQNKTCSFTRSNGKGPGSRPLPRAACWQLPPIPAPQPLPAKIH